MDFFKRFANGLFAPSQIGQYRQDKWYTTLFFFLILLIVSLIPVTIDAMQFDLIDWGTQRDIKRSFQNVGPIPFEIQNGKLIHSEQEESYVFTHRMQDGTLIIFNQDGSFELDPLNSSIALIFVEEGIYLQRNVVTTELLKFEEYEATLQGLDFQDAYSPNNLHFWDIVFDVMSQKAAEVKPMLTGLFVLIQASQNIFYFLLYSFIITIFQSPMLAGKVKFLKIWQMSIYILTPYVFGSLLGILFNASIIGFIGLIMTVLYGSRMAKSLWNNAR